MIRLFSLFLFSLLSFQLNAQQIRSLTVAEFLEIYTAEPTGEAVLYNFWATWCGPCVKELPYFESLNEREADFPIKVILVSLDFANGEERLAGFVDQRGIQSEIIYLSDWSGADQAWIETVHPEWTGGIPITVLKRPASDLGGARLTSFEDEMDLRSWLAEFN